MPFFVGGRDMTKGRKNAVIIMSIAVVLLMSVAVSALLVGPDKVLSFIKGSGGEVTQTPDTPVDGLPTMNAVRPAEMKAVFLDAENLSLSGSSAVEKNTSVLKKTAEAIKDKGFDTVLVSIPDKNELVCKDGVINILSTLAQAAKEQGLYVVVAYSGTDFGGAELSSLDKVDFDCIAFVGKMTSEQAKSAVSFLRTKRKNVSAAIAADSSNVADMAAVLSADYSDFLISLPADKQSAGEGYIDTLELINDTARLNSLSFAASIRADLLSDSGADGAMLITEQLDACATLDSCCGNVMYDYDFFLSDNSVASVVLKYMADKNREELEKDFELKNFSDTSKKTNESKLTFTGSSSPLSELKLNGKAVEREANGDFSFEVELKVGKNEFKFEHKGKTYNYTVTYEIKILGTVSPSKAVEAPGGSSITVKATALKGATVTATLGDMKITLKQLSNVVEDENGTMLDDDSDFAVYSGKFTLPASKTKAQSLGRIKVYADFNGISATASGASVSVSAVIPTPTPEPEPTVPSTSPSTGESSTEDSTGTTGSTSSSAGVDFDPSKMLTPYSYAGVSGKSKMCEITSLCETMPANVVDDCVPYSSPLPAGTFDYISSEYTYGGSKYYRLASGRNILASKAKLISSGYNLPQNKVSVVSSSSGAEGTVIKFGMLWKAPFNIGIKNQSYIPQSQASGGSLYSVSSFNGKYLDLTFAHTSNVTGKVNITGSPIISSIEWITNSTDKTLTLRMTLKNAGRFYGFVINYTSDGCLTLTVKAKPSQTLKGSVIMLDPGHGGNDSGAICAYNPDSSKKYEKQINLLLAQKIKAKLEEKGAKVIMTRSNDTYYSLDYRVNEARTKNPDMFIAVHCDSSESATPMGTSAYYYQAYSFPLASAIHNSLVSTYKKSIYAGSSSTVLNKIDRGTNMYPFKVTRIEECPAVLIEYGFVSNINECKLLWSNSVQDKLAQATVEGIENYISSN